MSRRKDEQGAAALELVLVAPVILVMLLMVIGLGRMANARQEVTAVAADAARAASLERNTSMSAAAAKDAAARSLADGGISCTGLDVDVDVSAYRPGGQVTVRVACTTLLSDVAMSGLPGKRVFTASSTVPIETYRSR